MAYQPRIKSPKGSMYSYKKSPRKKDRDRRSLRRRAGDAIQENKTILSEREISEVTLKRLHTLGNQRFGSFPYSDHFSRWLTNVTFVLNEFESNPNITVDEQFVAERSEILATIKMQLEDRHRLEASVNQEINNLSEYKMDIQKINEFYVTRIRTIIAERNKRLQQLNEEIEQLKKDQDEIIRMKTGFLRGISKKAREQKEIEITERLNDKQNQVELAILELNAAKKKLQEECAQKKEPLLEPIRYIQRSLADLEMDGSLEERWFSCEALVDSINALLQRKAMKQNSFETNITGQKPD